MKNIKTLLALIAILAGLSFAFINFAKLTESALLEQLYFFSHGIP